MRAPFKKPATPNLPEKAEPLLAVENQLRLTGLIFHPTVKKLLKNAYKCQNPRIFEAILFRLELALKNHGLLVLRTPDVFRPYCPDALSKAGDLYVCDQMDGIKIFDDHNKLVTGLGILGSQGGGKSTFIIHLCEQIIKIDSTITVTILDPKVGFRGLPGFITLDLSDLSFDLTPPANVQRENFVHDLTPILSNIGGLIYGLDPLEQAVEIAIQWRYRYLQLTGIDPGLCLEDIRQALRTIKVSGFRQTGYRDAALTVLSLIIGKRNLFACRKGVDLHWLFSRNVVLNSSLLTDDIQCRFLITFMLFWLFQKARSGSQTNKLRHIFIVDDASRFVGTTGSQFDGHSRTSPLGHLLAVLRSSGVCFCFSSQLPAQIDPAILSLTRNYIVIGNVSGEEHLRAIKNAMSLTEEQKCAIARFKSRETLLFFPNSNWPYPIHGSTPEVLIPATIPSPSQTPVSITPWHSLTQIPQPATTPSVAPAASVNPAPPPPSTLSSATERLVRECALNPFDNVTDHINRLSFSVRIYESAQNEALQNGWLLASSCGKSVYLISTAKAYSHFNIICPYKRAASVEHAFYVNLAAHYLKKDSLLKVQIETPIGVKGATIDITTIHKNGEMMSYEITLSTSNLLSNAGKLQEIGRAHV